MLTVIGGEKGGTGKSTAATSFAVIRTKQRIETLLYDIDSQATSTYWASLRDEYGIAPRIASTQKLINTHVSSPGVVIRNELKALLAKYPDIIVDAGGAINEVLSGALTLADFFIMPLNPSAFDLWTLRKVNALISSVKTINPTLKAYVFYNQVPQNPYEAAAEIKNCNEILREDFHDLQLLQSHIIKRASIRRAQAEGLSVVEYKPVDEKAVNEVMAVYNEVYHDKA
jgi:chromosome partitioning protein